MKRCRAVRRCRNTAVRSRERDNAEMLSELTFEELESLGLMKPWLQEAILTESERRIAETAVFGAAVEEIREKLEALVNSNPKTKAEWERIKDSEA